MPTLAQLFAEGYAIGEAIPREARARKAAKAKYGDAAENPELFNKLQQMEYAAADQGRKDAYLGIAQSQEARAGAREKREQGTYDFEMQGAKQNKQKEAALRVVNAMRSARDRGEPLDATFDKIVPMLESMGVDPADFPDLKKQVVDNPAILDDYYSALTSGTKLTTAQANAAAKAKAAEQAKAEGEQATSEVVQEMRDLYTALDEGKGIVNPNLDGWSNFMRKARSSWAGRTAGSWTGSKNESLRKQIEVLRPHLINIVKSAEGLGAKMFDSNKDMEMWLATMSDPGSDFGAVMQALDTFDRRYGAVKDKLKAPEAVNKEAADANAVYPGFVTPDGKMRFKGGNPGDKANWEPVK